ncbi:MAG: peptidoglycan-associated lipoprotein, partial [Rhizorhabdus sp.]|nr:peptidoglycan-associated lipoprotein [Rhizorhabdus sp.]
MARLTMKIALVSALALSVAACSKKKVEDLPPPPPTA